VIGILTQVSSDLTESMHMLHHLSFAVVDLARSATFFIGYGPHQSVPKPLISSSALRMPKVSSWLNSATILMQSCLLSATSALGLTNPARWL
jgi:hypothetical protein